MCKGFLLATYLLVGVIYLICFDRPVGTKFKADGTPTNYAQAKHYVGWALDPHKRHADHLAGRGAALTRYAVQQGIGWTFYILGTGTRFHERAVKNLKAAPRFCPCCSANAPRKTDVSRYLLGAYVQPADDGSDPFDIPAPAAARKMDRYEAAYLARQRKTRQPVQPVSANLSDEPVNPWDIAY